MNLIQTAQAMSAVAGIILILTGSRLLKKGLKTSCRSGR